MTGQTHGGVRGARFSSDGERHRERIVRPRSMRPRALAKRRGSAASFHTHEIKRTSSLKTRATSTRLTRAIRTRRDAFEAAPICESARHRAAPRTGKTGALILNCDAQHPRSRRDRRTPAHARVRRVHDRGATSRPRIRWTRVRHRPRRALRETPDRHCASLDEALRGPGFS